MRALLDTTTADVDVARLTDVLIAIGRPAGRPAERLHTRLWATGAAVPHRRTTEGNVA